MSRFKQIAEITSQDPHSRPYVPESGQDGFTMRSNLTLFSEQPTLCPLLVTRRGMSCRPTSRSRTTDAPTA